MGRLFKVRGGVHPAGCKDATATLPIRPAPMPAVIRLPLQQHIGAIAEELVRKGDKVLKGQLIARAGGKVSAAIHAPTSGTVVGVGQFPAPHPSGLPGRTIAIKPDGADRWTDDPLPPLDPETAEPAAIAERAEAAGLVGMGGATFPAAVKLGLAGRYEITTLVLNGAECEPFLTSDDRLMRERPARIIAGARLMARALGAATVLIAVERNKPEAIAALTAAIGADDGSTIKVVPLPARYPMGSEKHLVQALTGRETPARALTADLGVVVHNVATAAALADAVCLGRPLISRLVTVTGGAIRAPQTLEVLVGTPVAELVAACGGYAQEPAKLIAGGPMMGQPLPSDKVSVVKGTNGILALTAAELGAATPSACIRCGRCVAACPNGLVPLEMAARVRKDDLEGAAAAGLGDCIGCGACAYTCPARLPLVQYFNHAKGMLAEQQRRRHKLEEARRLTERRTARLEAQARAKKEAAAKRAAARKAKERAS